MTTTSAPNSPGTSTQTTLGPAAVNTALRSAEAVGEKEECEGGRGEQAEVNAAPASAAVVQGGQEEDGGLRQAPLTPSAPAAVPRGVRGISGSGGVGGSGTAIDAAISVSAAGSAGTRGEGVESSSNRNLLATVCLLKEYGSCGGIESGGGDETNHDETVPIEGVERAPTQVTGIHSVVAGDVMVQAVVETTTPGQDTEREQPVPASEALVAGDVAVQAAEEAGAVMPTSSGSGSGSENGGSA
ncbi:unnamed protein product [Ectocarpus sp. 4 AP-2014]